MTPHPPKKPLDGGISFDHPRLLFGNPTPNFGVPYVNKFCNKYESVVWFFNISQLYNLYAISIYFLRN